MTAVAAAAPPWPVPATARRDGAAASTAAGGAPRAAVSARHRTDGRDVSDGRDAEAFSDLLRHKLEARQGREPKPEPAAPPTAWAAALPGDEQRLHPDVAPADITPTTSAVALTPLLQRGDERGPPRSDSTIDLSRHAAVQPALRALQAALPTPLASAGEVVAQASWELTLQSPSGAPMQLRAVRAPELPAHAAGAWALTLAVPPRESALLGRHVARLNERLRAHTRCDEDVILEDNDAGDPA